MTAPPTHKGESPHRVRGIAMTRKTITQPAAAEAETALTAAEVAAIRERYRIATEDTRYWDDSNQEREADRSSMYDVPDLLAEVARLQAQLAEVRKLAKELRWVAGSALLEVLDGNGR